MLLILLSENKTKDELEKDTSVVKKALDIMSRQKNKTGEFPPLILNVIGYQIYAIPGTIEEIEGSYNEETGKSMIQLNMKNIMEMSLDEGE